MSKKNYSYSEFSLKMVALVFMVLDHVHTYLGVGSEWISLLPRFVAPLFLYFLVEGFYHTSDWKKYFFRVFSFAMLMMLGNGIINYIFGSVDHISGKMTFYSLQQGNNIFLTLAVYLLILKMVEVAKLSKGVKKCSLIFGIMALSLFSLPFCEGSFYLLPLLFAFYFFRGNNKRIYISIALWSMLLLAEALISHYSGAEVGSLYSTLCFSNEWAMIAVILPISLYSGERGNNGKVAKWLFYLVYPLHLWILLVARHLMNMGR
ncbi:MAG: TraX family protein [Peptostreptococcaceae bacterium]|nr:TraX family protein [Peptostreptococcaceae bacterium]